MNLRYTAKGTVAVGTGEIKVREEFHGEGLAIELPASIQTLADEPGAGGWSVLDRKTCHRILGGAFSVNLFTPS